MSETKLKEKKTTTTEIDTSKLTDKQKEIYDKCSEEFWDGVLEIHDYMAKDVELSVTRRFNLGHKICKIRDKCGPTTLTDLQEFFDTERSTLSSAVMLYERFTKDELEAILKRRKADGSPLYWTHIQHLTRIQDPIERSDILEKMLSESWTTKELNEHVQEAGGGKKSAGGRKPSLPKDLSACLGQIQTATVTWQNKHDQVWSKLSEYDISGCIETNKRKAIAEKIEEAISANEQLEQSAASMINELERLRSRVANFDTPVV